MKELFDFRFTTSCTMYVSSSICMNTANKALANWLLYKQESRYLKLAYLCLTACVYRLI